MNKQEQANTVELLDWLRKRPEEESLRMQVKTVDVAFVKEHIRKLEQGERV